MSRKAPMALSMALLKFLLLFPYGMMGKTIVCDGGLNGKCYNTTVDCGKTDDCTVYCNSTYGCYQTKINCTLADNCTVHIAPEVYQTRSPAEIYCARSCNITAMGAGFFSIYVPAHSNSSILCQTNPINFESACGFTNIEVDHDATVDVLCEGDGSCAGLSFNATSNNAILNITCIEGNLEENICELLEVTGGSHSTINLSCTGEGQALQPCAGAYINGGPHSSINMLCSLHHNGSDMYSNICAFVHIIGQTGSNINVSCFGDANCYKMEIDGRDAASLTLQDCAGDTQCDFMTIWCPQQVNGKIMCNLGRGDRLSIAKVYAVSSWDDVELITPMKCPHDESTMYCSTNYSDSCIFGGKETLPDMAVRCDDFSSGCCAEQQVDTFIDCAVSEGMCKNPDDGDLSTVEIVMIVICTLVGAVLLIGLLWAFLLREMCLKNSLSDQSYPMSEESDAFVQRDDQ